MNNQDKIHVLSRAVIIEQKKILLCQTIDHPKNFYFLPGGHIKHGESAENCLLRELLEETGYECHIKKFLGCLEYSFEPSHFSICHNHEYNFIFEVKFNDLNYDKIIESPEQYIKLVWVPLVDISKIDFRADPLKTLLPKWLSITESNSVFMSQMD